MGILSFVTWLPLVGALVLAFMPEAQSRLAKIVAMSFVSATFLATLIGVVLPFLRAESSFHFQLVERFPWFPEYGIRYQLGIDGISVWLIALTALLSVVAVASSLYVDRRVKAFMALLLALESFMIGAFASLDLILFFTFFELTLFPMWALISIWGGAKRNLAGAKFFIYTFAGSIFMLVGIIALAFRVPGGPSFDIVQIQHSVANGTLWAGAVQAEMLVFWAFAIALLVKAPAFPFHTWMPTTYAESPTVVPILSSVMVKLGTYGLLRFCLPLFPDVVKANVPILMALAVIGILYAAIIAAVQPDFRRLVAYSSVSHMGFILLGIFSLTHDGMVGGAFQQLSHGITAAATIMLLGFLYERRKSQQLEDYGGLKAQMPLFAAFFLLVTLGSVALPFTSGFTGEFLALLGAFEASAARAFGLSLGYAVLAAFGVVLSAAYLLRMFQKLFYGPVNVTSNQRLKDLKPWECALAAVLVLFILWGGMAPNTFLKPMEASIQATRMMAVNPVGTRPDWSDEQFEIAPTGELVKGQTTIAPADLHLAPNMSLGTEPTASRTVRASVLALKERRR